MLLRSRGLCNHRTLRTGPLPSRCMRNLWTCPWTHSWIFMPLWDKTKLKKKKLTDKRRLCRSGNRQARQTSAVFPPQRRCMKRRITARMVIPPGTAKSELLYPGIFQKMQEPRKRPPKEGAEESLAVCEVTPIQILSERTIKEHRGIRTWLRALLETGTRGHFLLLTFIRFISGLPKISERRGR